MFVHGLCVGGEDSGVLGEVFLVGGERKGRVRVVLAGEFVEVSGLPG